MSNVIRFYGKTSNVKYWPFSNFYHAPFKDSEGTLWTTTEHYYQAMKFLPEQKTCDGKFIRNVIRESLTPKMAAELGRNRSFTLRNDWEMQLSRDYYLVRDNLHIFNERLLIKDLYMYNALSYKFTQHEDLKQLLLDTNDAEIIEASPVDFYWGEGKDCSGKNMLGKLLMMLRDELRI